MATIAAFGLLAALVPVPIVAIFLFTFTPFAAATVFASADDYFTGNFDLHDTQLLSGLYTYVYHNT